MEREDAELAKADRVLIVLKWLARETGVRYASSSQELNDVVFGAFWKTPPARRVVCQAEIDFAYQAAMSNFGQYAEQEVSPVPCPMCQDRVRLSRRENDFTCRACRWSALDGTFGATFVAGIAEAVFADTGDQE